MRWSFDIKSTDTCQTPALLMCHRLAVTIVEGGRGSSG